MKKCADCKLQKKAENCRRCAEAARCELEELELDYKLLTERFFDLSDHLHNLKMIAHVSPFLETQGRIREYFATRVYPRPEELPASGTEAAS